MDKMYFSSNDDISVYYARNTEEGKALWDKSTELYEAEQKAEIAVLEWEEEHDAEAPFEMYQAMFDAQKANKAAYMEFETAWKAWASANHEWIEMID
ncbi:MAG: hypothetical protein IJH64_00660 [Oscillospiraceae bacterium]|nr:hypothetical protein [Oscillospiraceae bacterium]